jgi:hypothetical protein
MWLNPFNLDIPIPFWPKVELTSLKLTKPKNLHSQAVEIFLQKQMPQIKIPYVCSPRAIDIAGSYSP